MPSDPLAEPPRTQTTQQQVSSEQMLPKFTIVTVTYNADALIERTISSVESQDYSAIEHVIIDGNSQDDTLPIIHHYLERNSISEHRHEIIVRSEPDDGLYDAMNKALDLASGEYILYLNAGDTLHSPTVISELSRLAQQTGDELPAVLYGHTSLVDETGKFLRMRRLVPPIPLHWKSFRSGMLVCHQSFVPRVDVARQFHYDFEHYRFSADFDWCIRIMREAESQHLSLVPLRSHGELGIISDFLHSPDGTTRRHHKASLWERFRIMANHYGWCQTTLLHAWFVVRAVIKR